MLVKQNPSQALEITKYPHLRCSYFTRLLATSLCVINLRRRITLHRPLMQSCPSLCRSCTSPIFRQATFLFLPSSLTSLPHKHPSHLLPGHISFHILSSFALFSVLRAPRTPPEDTPCLLLLWHQCLPQDNQQQPCQGF